jgi:excisionase family DNA binding protein
MRSLSSIPPSSSARLRSSAARLLGRVRGVDEARAVAPLIDAKAASKLLGVPHTWLLAQARAGRIPHHRLGHYVRFDPEDLRAWLTDTKIMPTSWVPGRASNGRDAGQRL